MRITVAASMFLVTLACAPPLVAQTPVSPEARPGEPRFVIPSSGVMQPPAEVDPAGVPAIQRRIALSLDGATRADALRAIGQASGLNVVYESQLVQGGAIRLRGDSISIASALTTVLAGTNTDILLAANGSLIVMSKPAVVATTRPEVIRGRVTTDSGAAIAGATVIATMAPDRLVFRGTTQATGQYRLDIPAGTGDYLVYISAVGRTAFRKRVTRVASESVFVVDAKLARDVTQMSVVTVKSKKLTPVRGAEGDVANPGDRDVDGIAGGMSVDDQGNLGAMAAMIPGFERTSDGFSAFGLPTSQNAITLNGMAFPGADLPRDARVDLHLATSPFDPSIGWFSGAQLDIRPIGPGGFNTRRARLTMDAPAGNGIGANPNPAFDASFVTSGRVDMAYRYAYSIAAQAKRQTGDASNLLDSRGSVLRDLGLSPDSLARLVTVLNQLGIPSGLPAGGSLPVSENGSVLLHFEKTGLGGAPVPTTFALDGYAKVARLGGLGFAPGAAPSVAWGSTQHTGSIGGSLSHYFGEYLVDARSTLASNVTSRQPYSEIPAGHVLVQSDLGDGQVGIDNPAFGGNALTLGDSRQLAWDNSVEAKFYIPGSYDHRIKVTARARYDNLQSDANNFGAFSFASLDDLANNQPESFTRVVGALPVSSGVWNGVVAVGDLWRPTSAVQINYGVRLEGAAFTSGLDDRPDVDSRFGLNTGRVPNSIYASPRLGFSWRRGGEVGQYRAGDLGAFRLSAANILRGGIGEFRNITSASPALDALTASRGGTPLDCIGPAVPTPDWSGYANDLAPIPQTCRGGAPGPFVDAKGTVHAFSPDFAPPRSWRANLSYTLRPLGVAMTLDGTVSYNLDQPGIIDRNLGSPAFIVPGEGRVVYAPVASIAPSGLIATSASREDAAFGSVIEHRSDLRSLTDQYTVTAMPHPLNSDLITRFAYTFRTTIQDARGFDATTFGDVNTRAWTSGSAPRHQFQTQLGWSHDGLLLMGIGRLSSGRSFTPIVSSDVNGDGLVNDRAFVLDPANPTDPTLVAPFQSLLASTSGRVRSCLVTQAGRPAAQNSCAGPWTSSLDGTIRVVRPELKARRIMSVDIGLTNLPSLADAALHGSNLRGWGQSGSPDPVLYFVRGFNAATQQFQYTVNPAFGQDRPAIARLLSPFRLSIDVSIDVGTPVGVQRFNDDVRGRGSPGERRSEAELRRRFGVEVPDVYAWLFRDTDALLLSRSQVDSLNELHKVYLSRLDPVWTDLAKYTASLGDDFDHAEAYRRHEAAVDQAWVISWYAVREMVAVLNPIQVSLLQNWPRTLYLMAKPGNPNGAR